MPNRPSIDVSIVVPLFNELENVRLLYSELISAMQSQPRSYEIVFVDDGSTDATTDELRQLAEQDPKVKLVIFRRNYGQTAAMHAGIRHASGDAIVTIDGDLQNDPHDIPFMLDTLDDGYDLVHGWRKDRQDDLVSRKLPSQVANWIISRVTGFPIRDLGCTLKAMNAGIARQIELYGEMHRFIPILAQQLGARSVEVETNHRPRLFGSTSYGLSRTVRVILDLITVKYMIKYFASPMQLFGLVGMWVGLVGVLSGILTVGMKVIAGTDITGNPLMLLCILSVILSVQFFSLGLLGEVSARIYYSREDRQNYQVRELINFDVADATVSMVRDRAA